MDSNHHGLREDIFKVAVCLQQFKTLGVRSRAMAVKRRRDGSFAALGWAEPSRISPALDDDVLSCAKALQAMSDASLRQVGFHFDPSGRLAMLSGPLRARGAIYPKNQS